MIKRVMIKKYSSCPLHWNPIMFDTYPGKIVEVETLEDEDVSIRDKYSCKVRHYDRNDGYFYFKLEDTDDTFCSWMYNLQNLIKMRT